MNCLETAIKDCVRGRPALVFVRQTLVPAVITLLAAAIVLSACARPPVDDTGRPGSLGAGESRIEPQEVASFECDGEIRPANERQAISPGGKHVLAVQSGEAGMNLVAIALEGDGQRVRTLHSVDRAYMQKAAFGYHSLGWLSETRCVFAITGWQNSGPHKGRRGLAVLTGDLESGSCEEVAFIAMPEGILRSAVFARETGKAQFCMSAPGASSAIWECDVREGRTRLIRGSLPVYDGMFRAQRSPDGRYVYELHENDATGTFILDAETGMEKPLLPRGETMSFLPSWSPDGRYVAAYPVNRKSGAPASQDRWTSSGNYDLLAGEDGPRPAGGAITVVGVDGKIVQTIRVEGKTLSTFTWSPSSDAIGFVAGRVQELAGGLGEVYPESVWLAWMGGSGSTVKVADIPRDDPGDRAYVVVHSVDPDGQGLLYTDYRDQKTAVWRARRGPSGTAPQPVKVDDGALVFTGGKPVYGESFVEIVEGNQRSTAMPDLVLVHVEGWQDSPIQDLKALITQ